MIITKSYLDELTYKIIGCAIEVHKQLGPGLLESVDVLVEDLIIVELKAMDGILPVHEAQLLTYMKLLQKPKGIRINFNCTNIFKDGQKTLVNEYYASLPTL